MEKNSVKKKREQLFEQAKTAPPTLYFISRDLLSQMAEYYADTWCYPMIIADEYQSFKSPDSKRTKTLMKIQPYVQRLIGLTGTPTPNGLDDLWSLIYLLDNGKRLGKTIDEYFNKYFIEWKTIGRKVTEWIPNINAEKEIYEKISDIAISLNNTQLNLPPVIYSTKYAYLSETERNIYNKMMNNSRIFFEEQRKMVRAVNPAVLVSKLAQIASGIMYTDKEHNYTIIHKAKIEQLRYIYDNTPENEPILVAYHFQTDIIAITEEFKNAVVFDGNPETIKAWNRKEIKMLLIQPASAGFGLNLQDGGHILIWYTPTWSLEEYLQTNARLYRQGQKETVNIIHICAENTIDERILMALDQKDTSQTSLMNAIRFSMDIS